MKKQISITIDRDQLKYLDDLAKINSISRSAMIGLFIKKSQDLDKALDELEKSYGADNL